MKKKPRLAVIGVGYMGSQHARVISASAIAELAVVVDVDKQRARELAGLYDAKASTDIVAAHSCDAAIVASATDSHTEIAVSLIKAGVPTIVEKPLAANIDDVEVLVQAADDLDVPLACGFVERFNPVVTTAQGILDELPTHIVALRHSPTTPRMNNSVIYDLLIHDLDLAIQFVKGSPLIGVAGVAWSPQGGTVPEIADCTLAFQGGTVATLSASRASQRKLRLIQICTQSMLIELDLLRQDVTVYRNVRQEQDDKTLTYRAETVVDIPFVRHAGEPLALQLEHFLDLVDGLADPGVERAGILASHRAAVEIERSCPGSTRAPHLVLPR